MDFERQANYGNDTRSHLLATVQIQGKQRVYHQEEKHGNNSRILHNPDTCLQGKMIERFLRERTDIGLQWKLWFL